VFVSRSLPYQNLVVVPARQAYSHSASVGTRYVRPAFCSSGRALSFWQNSRAAFQEIESTGSSDSSPSLCCDGLTPVTAAYCFCVTRVAPRWKGFVIFTRCGWL